MELRGSGGDGNEYGVLACIIMAGFSLDLCSMKDFVKRD